MTERVVSSRAEQIAAATPFRLLWSYVEAIDYFRRRENPNVCDFTFGDPHEMASPAYVSAIQQAVVPLNESWFAYKWYEPLAQQAAAESLSRRTGLSFAAEDILTSGRN
jgi:aspartate aminotransferase